MAHPAGMKRFWQEVAVEAATGSAGAGWRILLDGRPVRTQGGNLQIIPTRALAELLAAEWAGQGETIDPSGFPMRDLADYAIDTIAPDPGPAIARVLRYGESDTLCYRADPDEPLHRRQREVWEPIVTAFEAREAVRLERASGVVHKPQPAATLATLRVRLAALDPLTLAALEAMTTLAASLCVGLSALDRDADPEALWHAAELEEAWQAELWGIEPLAEQRRRKRKADFMRTVKFGRAVGSD